MKAWELIAAFERHGTRKSDYFQFARLVRSGGKIEGEFGHHIRTRRYRRCLDDIMGILSHRYRQSRGINRA